MTTLLLERPPALDESFVRDTRRRLDGALVAERASAHGGLTLDDLITGVWEGLAVGATVNCPVCAGPMASRAPTTSGDAPTGECLSCGSLLS
jgi:hypothetical protein